MADATITFHDDKSGADVPLKAFDQGDGTHALVVDATNAPNKSIRVWDNRSRAFVDIGVVSQGDGTYAVCVR